MTVDTVPAEVRSYLEAVRGHLADLPPQERDDLLADVESSLVESARDGDPVAARLGPPESFAEELRSAAGLGTTSPMPAPPSRLARRIRELADDPRVARLRHLGGELAPVWWVARAYVAAVALALATGASFSTDHPAMPTWGLGDAALVALLLAAAASCWLGLRMRRAGRAPHTALAVANALLVVACVPVLNHLTQPSPAQRLVWQLDAQAADIAATPAFDGLVADGRPVTNIYAYSRDGKLLLDVLLYDENGLPIDLRAGSVDPDRRVLVTARGDRVFNSYPVRYYEPGTQVVAKPNAGPRPGKPAFVTPPIR
jgi:hypothetical protein